jgi:transposase
MGSLSEDLRDRVVRARERGESAKAVSERFEVHIRMVQKLWKQYREEGHVKAKQQGGYLKSRLAAHEKIVQEWVSETPDITLEEMQSRLADMGIKMSISGLWYRLDRLGLTYKKNTSRR